MTAPTATPPVPSPPDAPATVRRRRWPAAAGLTVALLAVAALGLLVGARPLAPGFVLDVLTGAVERTSPDALVVTEVRLPRTVLAVLAGAALGVAGVLAQGITRNPIAEPGILGLNTGAALAVVLGIALLGVDTLSGYVWFGFAGAAVAAAAASPPRRSPWRAPRSPRACSRSPPCSCSPTPRPSTTTGSGRSARSPAGTSGSQRRRPRSSSPGSHWP